MGRRKLSDDDKAWSVGATRDLAHSIETHTERVNTVLAEVSALDRAYLMAVKTPSSALLCRFNDEDQLLLRSLHISVATLPRRLDVVDLVDVLLDKNGPKKKMPAERATRIRWWNCSNGHTRWAYSTMRSIASRAKKYLAWNDVKFWFLFDPVYENHRPNGHWAGTSPWLYDMVDAWTNAGDAKAVEEEVRKLESTTAELARYGVDVDRITEVVRAQVARRSIPKVEVSVDIKFAGVGRGWQRASDEIAGVTGKTSNGDFVFERGPLRKRAWHRKREARPGKVAKAPKRAR